MARRGGGGAAQGTAGSMMSPVISIATGLLCFVVLEIFAPTIAGTIEDAQPTLGVDSDWNKTYNTDLPSGAEEWTTNAGQVHRIFADGDRSYPRDRDFDHQYFRCDVAGFWQNKPNARFASEV